MAKAYRQQIVTRFLKAIEQICADKSITESELASEIENLSSASLSQLRSGTNKSIKADLVVSVCEKYHYSILWVLTGKGEMKADAKTHTMEARLTEIEREIKKNNDLLGEALIPLIHEVLKLDIKMTIDKKGSLEKFIQKRNKEADGN